MSEPNIGFFTRLALAFRAFWLTLSNPGFALSVAQFRPAELSAGAAKPQGRPAVLKETLPDSALQLLGLLQQEGRFIDFLEENVSAYSDAEIGGAARVVHEGCHRAVHQHFSIEPIRSEQEGMRLTLQDGFDATSVRLTGNVVGKPPFTGTLMHRGWRVAQIKLPKLADGHDVKVLAPAEVEL